MSVGRKHMITLFLQDERLYLSTLDRTQLLQITIPLSPFLWVNRCLIYKLNNHISTDPSTHLHLQPVQGFCQNLCFNREQDIRWVTVPPSFKSPRVGVLKIYTFLGRADRVSFILSSCRLYVVASKVARAITLHAGDQLEILQRLERNAVYPMSILCVLCEAFHRPRLTNEWNAKEATRACVRSGDGEMYGKTTCNLFPTYVHFDLVAAITRSWRHKLGSYSPQLLESSIHFTEASVQIRCDIHAKVIEGRLIIKIEKVLFLGYQPDNALHGLPNLTRLLTKEDGLASCCPHIRWMELHPVVFGPEEGNDTEHEKTTCLWKHPGRCWRYQKLYSQPTKCRGEVTPELSKIWGCHFCYTDMTISYRHLDESVGVNLVTLTAWKDLGRGISINDPAWKTQSVVPGASSRQCDVGSLYHLFEGKKWRKASIPYVPEIKVEGFRRVHETLPASFAA